MFWLDVIRVNTHRLILRDKQWKKMFIYSSVMRVLILIADQIFLGGSISRIRPANSVAGPAFNPVGNFEISARSVLLLMVCFFFRSSPTWTANCRKFSPSVFCCSHRSWRHRSLVMVLERMSDNNGFVIIKYRNSPTSLICAASSSPMLTRVRSLVQALSWGFDNRK